MLIKFWEQNKVSFLVGLCIFEAFIIGCLYTTNKESPPPAPIPDVIEIIRDSIIRDSIFIVNEKIEKEIDSIKEQHKEDSIFIMSANDSVLFDLFTKYIEDYSK